MLEALEKTDSETEPEILLMYLVLSSVLTSLEALATSVALLGFTTLDLMLSV